MMQIHFCTVKLLTHVFLINFIVFIYIVCNIIVFIYLLDYLVTSLDL